MKNIFFVVFCSLFFVFQSCVEEDYDVPEYFQNDNFSPNGFPYGNNSIVCKNVLSISDLKHKYSNIISKNGMKQITDSIQIVGFVTGNDIGGNLYNEISIQDETGAILICISSSSLTASMPVGQRIVIDLKDLYIGGYGKMPQIGTPYTNAKGKTSVSRMNISVWNNHFRILDPADPSMVEPIVFKSSLNIADDCGKLVVLKHVKLNDANGKRVFAPSDGSVILSSNCANRNITGYTDVVLRTSTFANFAKEIMPDKYVDITGIATRYNNTWQILMRSIDDIKIVE